MVVFCICVWRNVKVSRKEKGRWSNNRVFKETKSEINNPSIFARFAAIQFNLYFHIDAITWKLILLSYVHATLDSSAAPRKSYRI